MSRSHGSLAARHSKDLQGMIIPGLHKAGESARSANVLSVRVCLLESNDPINRRSGGTSSAMSHLYRAPQEEHKIA
jgi:hypothetical protein